MDRILEFAQAQIGREMDINPNMITRWQREMTANGSKAFLGQGVVRDEEMVSLKRENNRLRKERDFLKEAAASSTDHCNTSLSLSAGDIKSLWQTAASAGQTTYRKHLGITVLSLLYGTGLRRRLRTLKAFLLRAWQHALVDQRLLCIVQLADRETVLRRVLGKTLSRYLARLQTLQPFALMCCQCRSF